MRAHNGSDALIFFQARPRRIEIKTSKLFRMPQAMHQYKLDKNKKEEEEECRKRTAGHVTRTNQSASSFHVTTLKTQPR